MSGRRRLRLFEATGVELEYMIVDRESLDVRAIADRVLGQVGPSGECEVERGEMAWSNELALHVIELKTNGPVNGLAGVAARFAASVGEIDALLAAHGARLMPAGMHPWMDPHAEMKLWPHEAGPIYRAFDRIFDCRGHGWANLQSVHVNLPFGDDDEFGRLHAAIRLLLPLLPALAASSPAADGRLTGTLDTRMEVYRGNSKRVPSVAGLVVPEPVFTRADYEEKLLGRIYRDMAPLDPEGTLRHEWVNSRGCIARFDRGAIEIRVMDVQECPAADLALVATVVAAVRGLVEGRFGDPARQREFAETALAPMLHATIRDAERARIDDRDYLAALGFPGTTATAGEVWRHLVECGVAREPGYAEWRPALSLILERGPLARRLIAALGPEPDRRRFAEVWRELCDCLAANRLFAAGA